MPHPPQPAVLEKSTSAPATPSRKTSCLGWQAEQLLWSAPCAGISYSPLQDRQGALTICCCCCYGARLCFDAVVDPTPDNYQPCALSEKRLACDRKLPPHLCASPGEGNAAPVGGVGGEPRTSRRRSRLHPGSTPSSRRATSRTLTRFDRAFHTAASRSAGGCVSCRECLKCTPEPCELFTGNTEMVWNQAILR